MVRLAIVKDGLDFNAIDGKRCKIFFLFITPSDQTTTHLQILAKISSILGNEKLRSLLGNADSPEAAYKILMDGEDKGKYGFINLEKASIFEELQTSDNGLTQEEAQRRLEMGNAYGCERPCLHHGHDHGPGRHRHVADGKCFLLPD